MRVVHFLNHRSRHLRRHRRRLLRYGSRQWNDELHVAVRIPRRLLSLLLVERDVFGMLGTERRRLLQRLPPRMLPQLNFMKRDRLLD